MLALVVFVGAGLGGVARYTIGTLLPADGAGFPWPTFFINVSGSFLLGFVLALLDGSSPSPEWRTFLGVGVLGGFTTFSTFSWETLRLAQQGEWQRASLYVLASVVCAITATLLGLRLASTFVATT